MTGPQVDELASAFAAALRPLVERLDELERLVVELVVPEWLTLEQAATHLGTSPDALRWRARHGRLPGAVKDEGRWLVDRRKLDAALAGGYAVAIPTKGLAPRERPSP